MGNDPILTLSQSVVLNLYTMVTIDWYRRKESNLHFLVRSEGYTPLYDSGNWWRWTGSNRRHLACKANALPTELHPQFGGPKGNRTPADGVTSRYTNHYTMEPELDALRPSAVIILHQARFWNSPSHTASTRSPTRSVLALPAHFRFEVYHP